MDNLAFCRLCGDRKLYLVDLEFCRTLLKKYCNIILENESKMPQCCCNDCINILNNFEKFCLKVKVTQKHFVSLIQDPQTLLNLDDLKTEKVESDDEEVDALPLKFLLDSSNINSQTITKQEDCCFNIPAVFVDAPKKSSEDQTSSTGSDEDSDEDDTSSTGSDGSYGNTRGKAKTKKNTKSSNKTRQVRLYSSPEYIKLIFLILGC